jgi:hypothetical protein
MYKRILFIHVDSVVFWQKNWRVYAYLRIYDNDYCVFIRIKTYQILSLKRSLRTRVFKFFLDLMFTSIKFNIKKKKKCVLILSHIIS